MPSPFPGMDPYLENDKLWPSFHHHLVTSLYQTVLPGLVDRYRARIAQRHYFTEQPLFTSVIREEHREEYLEIQLRSDSRIVTLVDVVSPANKLSDRGRQAYLDQRRVGRAQGCSLIEIDLLLQGVPLLEYSRDGLPEWDFAVTLTRASQPDRYVIYKSTLRKPLPRFPMPLANDDRDTIVDLQAAFVRSFEQGGFLSKIDYSKDPATKLDDSHKKWLANLLKQAKLR